MSEQMVSVPLSLISTLWSEYLENLEARTDHYGDEARIFARVPAVLGSRADVVLLEVEVFSISFDRLEATVVAVGSERSEWVVPLSDLFGCDWGEQ